MGLFNIFKKKQNKDVKQNSEPEYRNDYELKVELKYNYPSLFDSDKIYDNLNKFFDNYFSENPVNEYTYNGMGMLFGKGFMTDSCVVKVIFDEEKIEFLSEYQTREWERQLSSKTGIPEQSISIQYMTFEEKLDEMDRKSKYIQNLEKLNSELKESTAKLDEMMKDFEKNKGKW